MIPIWRADGYRVRLVFLSLPDAETAISRKDEIYNRTTVIAAKLVLDNRDVCILRWTYESYAD
jgi:hypothetical protein